MSTDIRRSGKLKGQLVLISGLQHKLISTSNSQPGKITKAKKTSRKPQSHKEETDFEREPSRLPRSSRGCGTMPDHHNLRVAATAWTTTPMEGSRIRDVPPADSEGGL